MRKSKIALKDTSMAEGSLLRVISNEELVRKEREVADNALAERQSSELLTGITAHIRTCWDAAKIARMPITTIMLKALRQRNGEYEADKLAKINEQGGSSVYMMITEVKCRAAESWLRDILLDTGTPPWDIQPTPIPSLNPDAEAEIKAIFDDFTMQIMDQEGMAMSPQEQAETMEMFQQEGRRRVLQEAQNIADRMRSKIQDQFAQGGWGESFTDFISDLVTFPIALIKGPVVRRQRILGWGKDETGKHIAEASEEIAPEFERVDPFRFYPEPGITKINDGYCFEHHPLTRTMLADLIGVPGYDEDAIRSILREGPVATSWVTPMEDLAKETQERKFGVAYRPTDMYDALEFWGKVSGSMLQEWGLTEEEVPDPAKEYDANVWVVGNYIIKAVLNYDPLGEKPYSKTSFIKCPGAFWGKGIPEIISDLQDVCNAAARSLVNNMGIASGPQVEVNVERLPPNEPITSMFPWKIWQVLNDPAGSSAPAIRFDQPKDISSTLMAVYDRFSKLADEHSGIPAYLYGDLNVQGAGRTSSGLSMLMGSAGKAIRQVVMHIDSDVIMLMLQRMYVYNMRYCEDEDVKGDLQVVARGAINLATKETMNVRRLEFLNATANPIDSEIMGIDGRSALLREVAKGLQLPTDEVVPAREKAAVRSRLKAAVEAQQPQQPQALDPAGSPKGGMEANTVQNRSAQGVSP